MKQAKVRNSNLELYRIIVMILIIAHHYVVNSGLTSIGGPIALNPTSAKSLFLLLFGAWGKTGINCFVFDYRVFYVQVSNYFEKVFKAFFAGYVLSNFNWCNFLVYSL